jgi:HPr kinase/phosphorylase
MTSINLETPLEVEELYRVWGKELGIELITGLDGLKREIRANRVQKPGLRMIEPLIQLEEGKVQILGRTEITFFGKHSALEQKQLAETLSSQDVPCFIVSKDLDPPEVLKDACEGKELPLFVTKLHAGKLISHLNSLLEERLAPFINVHGVLMDIHGLGVLILGKSGIGKSECALDLIIRGSKLIADDVVQVRKIGSSKLIGSGPKSVQHLMEIRGVGIINIKDLFGTTSVLDRREIDMVIELDHWNPGMEYDRLGLSQQSYTVMELDLPYLILPVSPGRNTATIIEVAVRNQLLKSSGVNMAEELENRFRKRAIKDIEP